MRLKNFYPFVLYGILKGLMCQSYFPFASPNSTLRDSVDVIACHLFASLVLNTVIYGLTFQPSAADGVRLFTVAFPVSYTCGMRHWSSPGQPQ